MVAKTIDNLYRQGANVLYSRIALVHVHGHASREELKMMLSLVNPQFFVPVHGEYRHLVAHASIAQSMGISKDNTFVLEDGDVLELTAYEGQVVDRVEHGQVLVDGRRKLWSSDSVVLNERRRLAQDGIVVVVITLDKQTGEPVKPAEVVTSGFVDAEQSQDIFEKVSKMALKTLAKEGLNTLELEQVKAKITSSMSDFLYSETRRRPTVRTVIEQI